MAKISTLLGCALFSALSPVYAVSFNSLGPVDLYAGLPGGSTYSHPVVSGDGLTVAGTGGGHGFTWTLAGGKVPLAGMYGSFPTALSYDGSVVVGGSLETDGYWRPVRWQGATKTRIYVSPEDNGVYASAVSAGGQTVVGMGPDGAFKWKNGTIWNLAGMSTARGASADATTIAGNNIRYVYPGPNLPTAQVWKNGVVTSLGSLTTGTYACSYAWGISPGGNVVFGKSSSTIAASEAFRWTAGEGMVGLGAVPGSHNVNDEAWMRASNYDGSALIGMGESQLVPRPIIWDAQHGIRFLSDVLSAEHGIDLTGWRLEEATGISWDGRTIVGYGISPQGVREGWVVNIPEPATLVLAALLFACVASKHR